MVNSKLSHRWVIMGPNTNSHHQSLVISILWPLGRGNVGYGSNIGSNWVAHGIADAIEREGETLVHAYVKIDADIFLMDQHQLDESTLLESIFLRKRGFAPKRGGHFRLADEAVYGVQLSLHQYSILSVVLISRTPARLGRLPRRPSG